MTLICKKCNKIADGLTNSLCSNCVKMVSFMEYWGIEDPEEATALFMLQQLNKRKMKKNESEKKKAGFKLYEHLPNTLKRDLKECGEWDRIRHRLILEYEKPYLIFLMQQLDSRVEIGENVRKNAMAFLIDRPPNEFEEYDLEFLIEKEYNIGQYVGYEFNPDYPAKMIVFYQKSEK